MKVAPHVLPDPAAVATAVADGLVARLAATTGTFRIALSGGSTPQLLFTLLAGPYRDRLPWSRLVLFWGDERCVPVDAGESNYHVARELLLAHVPLAPGQILRMHGELPPPAGAAAYEAVLREHFHAAGIAPQLDLALQGVGTDGHTASLFPGNAALSADALVAPVHHPAVAPPWRLTLTLPLLAGAGATWFLATGAAKAGVLAEIWRDPEAAAARYPAARLHATARAPAWYVDRAAAGA